MTTGSTEQRELLAKVELGLDAEKFLRSNVGQFLQSRALAEVEDCLIELKTADAENPKVIREIQQRIAVAECMFAWLNEAIGMASSAEHILNNME